MAPHLRKKPAKPFANRVQKSTNTAPKPITLPVRVARTEAPQFGVGFATVVVGDSLITETFTFAVHRALIASKSEYFKAALNWPGNTGQVTVDDVGYENFNTFVQWLYTEKIFTQTAEQATRARNDDTEVQDNLYGEDWEWVTLVNLYIMGDHLMAPKFKDAIIAAMIEKEIETGTMPIEAMKVYENTRPKCPLRRLIVDFHVYGYRDETLAPSHTQVFDDGTPKEFYQDVVATLLRAGPDLYKKKLTPWVEDPTAYQEPSFIDLSGSP